MQATRIDPLPESLAPDFLLKSLGIVKPQDIDIEAIAYYAGLRVKKRFLKTCEAMINGVGDHGVISVQRDSMPGRQRFSIAHELGHWHYHRGRCMACRKADIGTFSKTNSAERAADQYAADLLMPWPLFKPVCQEVSKLDLTAVRGVATRFSCSLTATLIRMIDSKRFMNAMAIGHVKTGRKWFKAADEIPDEWFPRRDLDPRSFAFDLLHSSSTGDQPNARRVSADAWFDNRRAAQFDIAEQSFQVPGEGIVTILLLSTQMLRDRELR